MKIPSKNKDKKDKIKKKEKLKPKKDQVLIVAQEIKFARLLSGNEKKGRDKVLKTLKKWLLNCFEKKYEFKEDDFVRMWKGLFYAVWMSDKPLIQEELCESISGVLDLFPPEQLKHALLMYKAGLRVLATEWYGVDHHRMDKFLMLVRRYLRASLRCLLRSKWSLDSCQLYANMISGSDGIFALKTPRYARNASSMLLHIIDCYLEEIAKVSSGDIPGESLAALLRPLCAYMCSGEAAALCAASRRVLTALVRQSELGIKYQDATRAWQTAAALCAASRRVLTALVRQSELGIKYQDATRAWQTMGCPAGGPEALELVSDEEDTEVNGDEPSDNEDDSTDKPLDPRAGRVNVELPLLPVPADLLADMLRGMLAKANSKAHKRVRICLERFTQLARDEYPLRLRTHEAEESAAPAVKPKQVAQSLQALEKSLAAASDELALRGLSRKHRKRLLAKSRAGISIVDDVHTTPARDLSNSTAGEWQVEPAEPEPKKTKLDTSDKENKKRKNDSKHEQTQKKRKSDKLNGDATDKRLKVASKQLPTIDISSKNNKNVKSKLNVISNSDKVTKIKQNGIINDKTNKKIVENKSPNKENDKKIQKTPEKIVLNGKVTTKSDKKTNKLEKSVKSPTVLVNKVKNFQKQGKADSSPNKCFDTPKKVKFVLKNNSMQAPVDYYKSIRQSPNIPFDGTKKPSKTNLKPSTPSPINPFFKNKLKFKK